MNKKSVIKKKKNKPLEAILDEQNNGKKVTDVQGFRRLPIPWSTERDDVIINKDRCSEMEIEVAEVRQVYFLTTRPIPCGSYW